MQNLLEHMQIHINTYENSIILFSPAGSSYDEFKNYIERGLSFNKFIDFLRK